MEKIMISEFVENYLNAAGEKRTSVVESAVFRRYVPCIEKKTVVDTLLNSAVYEKDGVRRLEPFAAHINFNMAMLVLYTNLDIDREGEEDREALFRAYDALQEHGLLERIRREIGESEIGELNMLRDMFFSDIKAENELGPQLGRQATRFGSLIGAALKPSVESLARRFGSMSDEELDTLKKEFMKKLNREGD